VAHELAARYLHEHAATDWSDEALDRRVAVLLGDLQCSA
jgi:hypothetical protein